MAGGLAGFIETRGRERPPVLWHRINSRPAQTRDSVRIIQLGLPVRVVETSRLRLGSDREANHRRRHMAAHIPALIESVAS